MIEGYIRHHCANSKHPNGYCGSAIYGLCLQWPNEHKDESLLNYGAMRSTQEMLITRKRYGNVKRALNERHLLKGFVK